MNTTGGGTWRGELIEMLRLRKSRQSEPTCFVVVRQSQPENTTVDIEEIVGIYTTLKEAQDSRLEVDPYNIRDSEYSRDTYNIREYVMNPPVIHGKYKKQFQPSCSGETWKGNPYWFEDLYADEDLDRVIEQVQKEVSLKSEVANTIF